jgi:GNAT superfamily N-acetyltransferase
VYDVLKQLRVDLSYDEFEDLIYDMRHIEYKMIGIMDGNILICYAGVAVQTNLYYKRHLYIFDLVTDEKYRAKGYGKMMLEFLEDYAKVGMCERVVLSSDFDKNDAHEFYTQKGFNKKSFEYTKNISS